MMVARHAESPVVGVDRWLDAVEPLYAPAVRADCDHYSRKGTVARRSGARLEVAYV
jgi:hypothetical protein